MPVAVTAISDMHGKLGLKLSPSAVLVIAGDICPVHGSHSTTAQLHYMQTQFLPWCEQLLREGIVSDGIAFTAGNHDFICKYRDRFTLPKSVYLLLDEECTIAGLRIYGTPWSNRYGNWAFMLDEAGLADRYRRIPAGLDILISHGPPYGYCDQVLRPRHPDPYDRDPHLGSHALRKQIAISQPKYVFVGHIHTGQHVPLLYSGSKIANVSVLDEGYEIGYPPLHVLMEPSCPQKLE